MKTIETQNAEQIKDKIGAAARPQNVMGRHFILVRQSDVVLQRARIGQPMRLPEQRFFCIISGKAVYRINLLDHSLCQGDVVRQQSGLSVMDWLNRITTTEAKVLLKHSDLMIYEIDERLNFPEPTAFNRYFKKQVGVTPLQYREGK